MTMFDEANEVSRTLETLRSTDPDDDHSPYDIAELIGAAAELAGTVTTFWEMPLRDRVADALRDENGLNFTPVALDVIMAVIESINWTDEQVDVPADVRRYAIDAEQKLRILRKFR